MATVRFTHSAREDLIELWAYIAERNPSAADRVYDLIEESCVKLRSYPHIGRARPEIAEDARSIVCERWVLLYRVSVEDVQIVRIIDGARDLASIDWPLK